MLTLLFLALAFLEPPRSALLRRLEAAPLIWRFGNQPWHLDRPAGSVDRDKRQIARIRVTTATGEQLLGFDANANFHRRAADIVHTRFHDNEIAEVDWLAEVDAVDRCRNDAGA